VVVGSERELECRWNGGGGDDDDGMMGGLMGERKEGKKVLVFL
jgi:hypothetical protein